MTLPPAFVRHKAGPDWVIDSGSATQEIGRTDPPMQADGLMPVVLLLLLAGSLLLVGQATGTAPLIYTLF